MVLGFELRYKMYKNKSNERCGEFSFLPVLGLEFRASHLLGFARQVLYHLNHSTSPMENFLQ
jgi:hypothetical protein